MAKMSQLLFLSTALTGAVCVSAQAGSFSIREQSVRGMGTAFAGVAASGGGLSGMFWNPAIVTSIGGRNSEWNVFGIVPSATMSDFSAGAFTALGGPGDVGVAAPIKASYANMQLTDRWFIGVSMNTPFGLGTAAKRGWAGNWDHIDTNVLSFNIAPTVGYKINEQLSFGLGVELQYAALTSTASNPALSAFGFPLSKIEGDGIAPGFTLGFNWEPMKGTSLGLGYRSFIRHKISAYQKYDVSPAFGALSGAKVPVTMTLTTPEMVTLSGRHALNDRFTMMGTLEYTHWGRAGTIPVVGSPSGSSFKLNYQDAWFFSLGGEYKIDPKWMARAGIGYELTPVKDAFRTMRLPDNDRLWLSLGASYEYSNKLSFDASYSYVKVKDALISQTSTTNPALTYSGTSHAHLHIIGVSARYQWDKPETDAPVVRKY